MNPKIIAWNMRGLNNFKKCLGIKNRQWQAGVICLVETKSKYVNSLIVHSLWSYQSMGWVDLVSNGALRGIIMMWDRRVVELIDHFVGDFLMACHFKSVDDD